MKVRKSILIGRFFLLVASGGLLFPMQALPLPQNGNVAAGQAQINQTGNQMTITQSSGKTIINWDSYSINVNELVQYLQPGANAISLNRVVGQNPSAILGQLIANGQVWIVNPNGVFFGKEATVNVAGLMATTLNISDSNFLNGNYEFSQQENSPLSYIINQGKIIINDNGYAVLVAPLVSNEGLIVANLGKVRIGAAEKFSVNFDGSNLVNFAISNPPDGQTPGTVLIPQSQITDVIKEVVNIPALIEAGDIVEEDGVVKLVSASGIAINTGTIKVDGAVGENAGSIVIDSTQATAIGPESLLTASGTGENSSGGEIKILSSMQDGVAMITPGATLEAKGGDTGDGGFIELSGRDFYLGNAVIDVSAPMGQTGIFLLDPYNIEITNTNQNGIWTGGDPNTFTPDGSSSRVSDATIEGNLSTANVIISTENATGTDAGNITLNSTIDYTGPNYLKLVADNDIVFNTGTINFTGTGDVYLIADSDYSGVGAILNTGEQTITLGGGRLLMVAGSGIGTSGSPILTSGGLTLSAKTEYGDINIQNTGDLTIDDWTGEIEYGVVNGGGAVNISSTGSIDIPGTNDSDNAFIDAYGDITLTAGEDITGGSSGNGIYFASSYRGNVTLDAGRDIYLGQNYYSDIEAAGDISLIAENDITVDAYTWVVAPDGGNISFEAGRDINLITREEDWETAVIASNGKLSLTAGNDINILGARTYSDGNTEMTAGNEIQALGYIEADGNASLTATSGDITVGSISAANINITASNASILDDGNDATVLLAGAGKPITLTAKTDIGSGEGTGDIPSDYLDINMANSPTLSVTATTGDIYLNFLNKDMASSQLTGVSRNGDINLGVTGNNFTFNNNTFTGLTNNFSLIANNIYLSAGGAGSIGTAGDITLKAIDGVIQTSAFGVVDITGNNLVMQATEGISDDTGDYGINTSVSELKADITSSSATGDIYLWNNKDLIVNGLSNAGQGYIALYNIAGTAQTMTINGDVTSNGGYIYLPTKGDLIINANISNDGEIYLVAGKESTGTGTFIQGTNSRINSGTECTEIRFYGNSVLNDVRGNEVAIIFGGDASLSDNYATTLLPSITAPYLVIDGNTNNILSGGINLNTAVTNLQIRNFASSVGDITINNQGDLSLSNWDALGSPSIKNPGGSVNITTSSLLNVLADVLASGDITLIAGDNDAATTDNITIAENVNIGSTGGDVYLTAGDDITQVAGTGVISAGGGDIQVVAGHDNDGKGLINIAGKVGSGAENLVMEADETINALTNVSTLTASTNNANITVNETSGLALNLVDAGTGDVTLTAGGAVTDNNGDDRNITGTNLIISAVTGIGSTDALETEVSYLNAHNSISGDINIDNTGDLTIDDWTPPTGYGVKNDGRAVNISSTGSIDIPGTNGYGIWAEGDITLTAGVDITGGFSGGLYGKGITLAESNRGKVTLDAENDIYLGQFNNFADIYAKKDITLTAGEDITVAYTEVQSSSGNVTLDADRDINLTIAAIYSSGITEMTAGNEIQALGSITAGGNASLTATSGDITVASISAANINITAGSSILDDGYTTSLSVRSGGKITLTANTDIGSTDGQAGIRPGFIDINTTNLSDGSITLTGGVGSNIYLNFLNGDFYSSYLSAISPNNTSTENSINSLTIGATKGNLEVNSDIFNKDDTGNPTGIYYDLYLLTNKNLLLSNPIETNEDILELGAGGDLTLTMGNITFKDKAGTVILWADFDHDNLGAITGGSSGSPFTLTNVENLILIAGSGINVSTDINPINIAAYNSTSGEINIDNKGDITIFDGSSYVDLSGISENGVNGVNNESGGDVNITATGGNIGNAGGTVTANNLTLTAAGNIQLGTSANTLQATGNGIIIISDADALDLADINGLGYSVLNSGTEIISIATGEDLTISDDIQSASAEVVLNSGVNILQNADIDTTYLGTSGADVGIDAVGTFTMAPDTIINAGDSDIEIGDNNPIGGNVTLGLLRTKGDVGINTDADVVAAANTDVEIVANELEINAGGSVGLGNQLDTDVRALTANVDNNDLVLYEADGLLLNNVNTGTGDVTLVLEAGTLESIGITRITADELFLTAPGGIAVNTDINELTAETTNNNIKIVEDNGLGINNINAGSGDVDITLAGTLTSNAGTGITANDLIITGDGAININTNVDTLQASTNDANITVNETSGLALNLVDAGTGNVTLTAGGAVTDGNGVGNNVSAGNLTLNVVGDVGTATDSIDTNIGSLTITTAGNAYISENDGITLNNINVGTLFDLDTHNNGNVTSATGTEITATSVNINADGAVDINTNIGDINVATSNDNVKIRENNGLVLNSVNAGSGDVDITLAGTLTSNAGTGITANDLIITGDGAIDINTNVNTLQASTNDANITVNETSGLALNLVNAGTGNVTLTAGGAVTDNNGIENNITANLLNITAPGGINLDTTINTLTANASAGNGNITIRENNGLALNSVNAGSGDVDITLAGALASNTGTGITANDLIITGDGAININTNVDTLQASTNNANITVNETSGLTLNSVNAGSGDVDITLAGTLTSNTGTGITANDLIITGDGAININTNVDTLQASTNNANITVNETSGLALNLVDAGTGDVTLTAGGAITDGNEVNVNIIGNDLVLTAVSGIGSGNALETKVDTLQATNTNNGIEIINTGALALNNTTPLGHSVQNTNGLVNIKTTSPLNVNANINAGGDITLIAGDNDAATTDNITIAANVNISSTGGDVYLTAGDDITQAAGTGVISAGGGDIRIVAGHDNDGKGLINIAGKVGSGAENLVMEADQTINALTNVSTLTASTNNANITVNETGGLALNSVNAGSGDVNITLAGVLNSNAGTRITANDLIITGDGAININTNVDTLQASTNNANITVNETGGLALNSVNAGSGDVDITLAGTLTSNAGTRITANDLIITGDGAININTNVDTLQASTNNANITVNETSGLALNSVNAGTMGNVTLTLAGGAITDNNGDDVNIVSNILTMTAANGIGSADGLETQVKTLSAANTVNDIWIINGENLIVNGASNLGGDIIIENDGDITITNLISASDSVLLYANGSILDGNNLINPDALDIRAGDTSELMAFNGTVGTWNNPVEVNITGDLYVYGSDKDDHYISVMVNGVVQPRDILLSYPGYTSSGLIFFNGRMNGGARSNQWFRAVSPSVQYIGLEPSAYSEILLQLIKDNYFNPVEPTWKMDKELEEYFDIVLK